MNKKNKFFSTILATLVGAAIWIPSAQADFIPYQLDTLLGAKKLQNSGDATELAAMQTAARLFTNSNIVLVQDLKIDIGKLDDPNVDPVFAFVNDADS